MESVVHKPGLVLTREAGETVCIGDDITVTIASVERGRVRLRIVAPRTISVDRQEVRDGRAMRRAPR